MPSGIAVSHFSSPVILPSPQLPGIDGSPPAAPPVPPIPTAMPLPEAPPAPAIRLGSDVVPVGPPSPTGMMTGGSSVKFGSEL
jgi:hypothetical protein